MAHGRHNLTEFKWRTIQPLSTPHLCASTSKLPPKKTGWRFLYRS